MTPSEFETRGFGTNPSQTKESGNLKKHEPEAKDNNCNFACV